MMKNFVNIYLADVRTLESFETQCLSLMAPECRRAAEKHRNRMARLRFIGSRLLLRKVLGASRGGDLIYNEYGKPFLNKGGPQFNLSSAGVYAVLAVFSFSVGVDIEHMKDGYPAILRRFFLPGELAWLDQAPSGERFSILWTRLESMLKAEGTGFALQKQRTCSLLKAGPPWFIKNVIHDGHMIACATEKPFKPRLVSLGANCLLQ